VFPRPDPWALRTGQKKKAPVDSNHPNTASMTWPATLSGRSRENVLSDADEVEITFDTAQGAFFVFGNFQSTHQGKPAASMLGALMFIPTT